MKYTYCPICKDRLCPEDEEYIKKYNMCRHCVTFLRLHKTGTETIKINPS